MCFVRKIIFFEGKRKTLNRHQREKNWISKRYFIKNKTGYMDMFAIQYINCCVRFFFLSKSRLESFQLNLLLYESMDRQIDICLRTVKNHSCKRIFFILLLNAIYMVFFTCYLIVQNVKYSLKMHLISFKLNRRKAVNVFG